MNYKELQTELKNFKAQGLTTIALNSKKEVLQAEYNRLTAEIEPSPVVEATTKEAPLAKIETPQPMPKKVVNVLMVMVTAFVKAVIFTVNAPLRRLILWSGEGVQNYHRAIGWWLDGFSRPRFA